MLVVSLNNNKDLHMHLSMTFKRELGVELTNVGFLKMLSKIAFRLLEKKLGDHQKIQLEALMCIITDFKDLVSLLEVRRVQTKMGEQIRCHVI
jgi:hypothetical protein